MSFSFAWEHHGREWDQNPFLRAQPDVEKPSPRTPDLMQAQPTVQNYNYRVSIQLPSQEVQPVNPRLVMINGPTIANHPTP